MMHLKINYLLVTVFTVSISCGQAVAVSSSQPMIENAVAASGSNWQDNGIVGEGEQQYTCFGKNGNCKLEPVKRFLPIQDSPLAGLDSMQIEFAFVIKYKI
jgi:hypothetical protein